MPLSKDSEVIKFEVSISRDVADALSATVQAMQEAGQSDATMEQVAHDLILAGLRKPRRWMCDTCGQPIQHSRDGLLTWAWNAQRTYARGLRIVHDAGAGITPDTRRGLRLVSTHSPQVNYGCSDLDQKPGEERFAIPLHHLTDADGLMQLLERIQEGYLPLAQLLEVMMRIHLPHYEEARPNLEKAIRGGAIAPNMSAGFYWQGELSDVIKWAKSHVEPQSSD